MGAGVRLRGGVVWAAIAGGAPESRGIRGLMGALGMAAIRAAGLLSILVGVSGRLPG